MVLWEYKVVQLGDLQPEFKPSDLTEHHWSRRSFIQRQEWNLNQLGRLGWELVSLARDEDWQYAYLKRQKA